MARYRDRSDHRWRVDVGVCGLVLAAIASATAMSKTWVDALAAAVQQPRPASLVRENATVKLTDHVWAIPDFNVGGVPNVGIIVGSRATMVVDTSMGPRNAETIVREMDKVSKNTEVYVATTHYLGDAILITRDREYLRAVQTRVGDLKRQGKTIDEVVQAVATEIAPKYPEWGNPGGSAATARAAFAEAK
jgi:hypothetical protein